MNFTVVGMRFRGFQPTDIVSTYANNTITLEDEPANPFDSNAIKVLVDGKHMGYVTKDDCAAVKDYIAANPVRTFNVVSYYFASVMVTMVGVDIPIGLLKQLEDLTAAFKALPLPA